MNHRTGCAAASEVDKLWRKVGELEEILIRLQKSSNLPLASSAVTVTSNGLPTAAATLPSINHINGDQFPVKTIASPRPLSADPVTLSASTNGHTKISFGAAEHGAATNHPDEAAALMLEDFAMGHRTNIIRATQALKHANGVSNDPTLNAISSLNSLMHFQPSTHGKSVMESPMDLNENEFESLTVGPTHPLAFLIDPDGTKIMLKALSLCPDHWRGSMLVRYYVGFL